MHSPPHVEDHHAHHQRTTTELHTCFATPAISLQGCVAGVRPRAPHCLAMDARHIDRCSAPAQPPPHAPRPHHVMSTTTHRQASPHIQHTVMLHTHVCYAQLGLGVEGCFRRHQRPVCVPGCRLRLVPCLARLGGEAQRTASHPLRCWVCIKEVQCNDPSVCR